MAGEIHYAVKQMMQALTNLDKRLRVVENREVPAGTTGVPPGTSGPTQPITPSAGWSAAPAPHAPAGYWRDEGSMTVFLQGRLHGSTFPSVLFTLPAGYRPTATLSFQSIGTIVEIDASGVVEAASSSGALYVNLDGISFRAA